MNETALQEAREVDAAERKAYRETLAKYSLSASVGFTDDSQVWQSEPVEQILVGKEPRRTRESLHS